MPSSKRAVPSAKHSLRSSKRSAPSWVELVHSDSLDSPFPERPMPSAAGDVPSAAWDVHAAVRDVLAPAEDVPSLERAARSSRRAVPSAKRSAPSLEEIVSSDLLDSPFPEQTVRSAKRSVRSKAADGVGAGEARYAALAERSAQTADCLMRRVRRHRATGR